MSIASELGLSPEFPGHIITGRWGEWSESRPALRLVPEPLELGEWVSRARGVKAPPGLHAKVAAVMRGLAWLAADDGGDDPEAALLLAWLMLPAAASVARTCQLVDPDRIDRIVASHLFVLVRTFPWRTRQGSVTANITRDLRRNVMRDLGVTAARVPCVLPMDPVTLEAVAGPAEAAALDADVEVERLLWTSRIRGHLTAEQFDLIGDLLSLAETLPVTRRHSEGGLGGLLNGPVSEALGRLHGITGRQARRRANACVAALAHTARELQAS